MFTSLRQTGQSPAGDLWRDTLTRSDLTQPAHLEATYVDDYRNDVSSGLHASATFSAVGYSPTFFTGRADLQCATILGRVLVRPKSGHLIDSPRTGLVGLAPGHYSSVTELEAVGVCMERSASGVVDVVSALGGTYLVVGSLTH